MDIDDFNDKKLDLVERLLFKRKQAACAALLSFKDDKVDGFLPKDVSDALRKEILDQINNLYESCLDVFESFDGSFVIVNELFKERYDGNTR